MVSPWWSAGRGPASPSPSASPAILGIGAASGVLGRLVVPRLSLIIGGLAAVVAGWGLRFRPSPDAVAWRRGAAGEHRTARLLSPLERHGWMVRYDWPSPTAGPTSITW
jgi:hypothetical protein